MSIRWICYSVLCEIRHRRTQDRLIRAVPDRLFRQFQTVRDGQLAALFPVSVRVQAVFLGKNSQRDTEHRDQGE